MRAAFRLAALAGLAGLAVAGCPNGCSQNGVCSQNDICTCNKLYIGADCSQRLCLSGPAWAADASDPHTMAECSNAGRCNRATGECECFDGFEGRACSRMGCPNQCTGHGVCKAIKDLNTTVAYSASNWDADRIVGCLCDPGFFGNDCSQQYCPTGDDPLTLCSSTVRNHVQEIKYVLGSQIKATGHTSASTEMSLFGTSSTTTYSALRDAGVFQMRVSFVDAYGAAWTGRAVSGVMKTTDATARDSLEVALETLPNNKVKDVTITTALDTTLTTVFARRFLVTFQADNTNSINVGLQRPLIVDPSSCNEAGCSPIVRMPFLYRYANTVEKAVGGSATPAFATGDANTGAMVRLEASSQPQMPAGIAVDTGVSSTSLARYDIRILVAVMDPAGDASDSPVDVYYTKVITGYDNIISDSEKVGSVGVWSSATFTPTLDGFTFQGMIPADFAKVPVDGAPGAYLNFPSRNMVASDNQGRWFEILIKLPHAVVTPVTMANQLRDITNGPYLQPVDANVENVECANRGSCDRGTGACACYSGYTGVACHLQSAMV